MSIFWARLKLISCDVRSVCSTLIYVVQKEKFGFERVSRAKLLSWCIHRWVSSILKQAHAARFASTDGGGNQQQMMNLSQGETMASKHLLGISATAVADSKGRERYKQQKQTQACPCSTLVRCMIKQQIARSARTGTQEKTLHLREFHSHVVHVAAGITDHVVLSYAVWADQKTGLRPTQCHTKGSRRRRYPYVRVLVASARSKAPPRQNPCF